MNPEAVQKLRDARILLCKAQLMIPAYLKEWNEINELNAVLQDMIIKNKHEEKPNNTTP